MMHINGLLLNPTCSQRAVTKSFFRLILEQQWGLLSPERQRNPFQAHRVWGWPSWASVGKARRWQRHPSREPERLTGTRREGSLRSSPPWAAKPGVPGCPWAPALVLGHPGWETLHKKHHPLHFGFPLSEGWGWRRVGETLSPQVPSGSNTLSSNSDLDPQPTH